MSVPNSRWAGYPGPYPSYHVIPLTFGRGRIVEADSQWTSDRFW